MGLSMADTRNFRCRISGVRNSSRFASVAAADGTRKQTTGNWGRFGWHGRAKPRGSSRGVRSLHRAQNRWVQCRGQATKPGPVR